MTSEKSSSAIAMSLTSAPRPAEHLLGLLLEAGPHSPIALQAELEVRDERLGAVAEPPLDLPDRRGVDVLAIAARRTRRRRRPPAGRPAAAARPTPRGVPRRSVRCRAPATPPRASRRPEARRRRGRGRAAWRSSTCRSRRTRRSRRWADSVPPALPSSADDARQQRDVLLVDAARHPGVVWVVLRPAAGDDVLGYLGGDPSPGTARGSRRRAGCPA